MDYEPVDVESNNYTTHCEVNHFTPRIIDADAANSAIYNITLQQISVLINSASYPQTIHRYSLGQPIEVRRFHPAQLFLPNRRGSCRVCNGARYDIANNCNAEMATVGNAEV